MLNAECSWNWDSHTESLDMVMVWINHCKFTLYYTPASQQVETLVPLCGCSRSIFNIVVQVCAIFLFYFTQADIFKDWKIKALSLNIDIKDRTIENWNHNHEDHFFFFLIATDRLISNRGQESWLPLLSLKSPKFFRKDLHRIFPLVPVLCGT